MQGSSEKQIAFQLGLSQHTVHHYVQALHRRFDVASRAELLAKANSQRQDFRPKFSVTAEANGSVPEPAAPKPIPNKKGALQGLEGPREPSDFRCRPHPRRQPDQLHPEVLFSSPLLLSLNNSIVEAQEFPLLACSAHLA